jgi:hypothetical protein
MMTLHVRNVGLVLRVVKCYILLWNFWFIRTEALFGEKPEIFIIGSAKSGTSTLSNILEHHPDICESVTKESHFFDNEQRYLTNKQYYVDFFNVPQAADKSQCKYYVDATPSYIRNPLVPERMNQSFTPSQFASKKFVLILRDPVLRECSWYYHLADFCVQEVAERLKTSQNRNPQFLCQEKTGSSSGTPHCGLMGCEARAVNISIETVRHVVDPFEKYVHHPRFDRTGSLYDQQITHWLRYISRQQLFIINMADLLRDYKTVTASLFSFLNISTRELQALPHAIGHGDHYLCGCDGLKEVHARLSKVNTTSNTLRIINQPGKPPQEPPFTPFEDLAFLNSRHCQASPSG